MAARGTIDLSFPCRLRSATGLKAHIGHLRSPLGRLEERSASRSQPPLGFPGRRDTRSERATRISVSDSAAADASAHGPGCIHGRTRASARAEIERDPAGRRARTPAGALVPDGHAGDRHAQARRQGQELARKIAARRVAQRALERRPQIDGAERCAGDDLPESSDDIVALGQGDDRNQIAIQQDRRPPRSRPSASCVRRGSACVREGPTPDGVPRISARRLASRSWNRDTQRTVRPDPKHVAACRADSNQVDEQSCAIPFEPCRSLPGRALDGSSGNDSCITATL